MYPSAKYNKSDFQMSHNYDSYIKITHIFSSEKNNGNDRVLLIIFSIKHWSSA